MGGGQNIALVFTNERDEKRVRVDFKDQQRTFVEPYLTSPADDLRRMNLKEPKEVILPKRGLLTLLFAPDPS